MVWKSRE
jgi:hypothetical protein